MRSTIARLYALLMGVYFDVALTLIIVFAVIVSWVSLRPPGGILGDIFISVPLGLLFGFIAAVLILGPALFLHQMGDDVKQIRRLLSDDYGDAIRTELKGSAPRSAVQDHGDGHSRRTVP